MSGEKATYYLIGGCCIAAAATIYPRLFTAAANFCINGTAGIAALCIGRLLLNGTGIDVGINYFTVGFAGIMGIPGVICLYVLRLLI